MKLIRFRSPKALLLSGLAAVTLTMATAEDASAQRRHLPLPPPVKASLELRDMVNSQCAPHDRSCSTRVRVPRGYDGGRYEWRTERVWVPGRSERIWEAPIYEWRRDPCGRSVRVCVRAGYWRTIQHPGCYETRRVKVWVPAPCRDVRRYDHRRDHRVSHVGRRGSRWRR